MAPASWAEGGDLAGRGPVIVKDVVTFGGRSSIPHGNRELWAQPCPTALCVIDREAGSPQNLADESIERRSLLSMSALQPPVPDRLTKRGSVANRSSLARPRAPGKKAQLGATSRGTSLVERLGARPSEGAPASGVVTSVLHRNTSSQICLCPEHEN